MVSTKFVLVITVWSYQCLPNFLIKGTAEDDAEAKDKEKAKVVDSKVLKFQQHGKYYIIHFIHLG